MVDHRCSLVDEAGYLMNSMIASALGPTQLQQFPKWLMNGKAIESVVGEAACEQSAVIISH